jgi:hypothetical protein
MACKGCKNKPISDLKDVPVKKDRLLLVVIIAYTLLAIYGLVRLIFDIKNLFI